MDDLFDEQDDFANAESTSTSHPPSTPESASSFSSSGTTPSSSLRKSTSITTGLNKALDETGKKANSLIAAAKAINFASPGKNRSLNNASALNNPPVFGSTSTADRTKGSNKPTEIIPLIKDFKLHHDGKYHTSPLTIKGTFIHDGNEEEGPSIIGKI